MGIETLTRGAKVLYEEYKAQEIGVDKVLFNRMDEDTTSAFMLDKFINSPFATVYREKNGQSHIREYQPGSGYIYDVPRASMKTAIDEDLRDAAIVGVESNAGYNQHEMKLLNDIVRQHIDGDHMLKWKQSLDVLRTGAFEANDADGNSIGLGVDFSRDTDNDLTYDFTAGTPTFAEAVKNVQDQLIAKGCTLNNLVFVMGSDWLTQMSGDSDFQDILQANQAQFFARQSMLPAPVASGASGMYLIGMYRAPGMVAPMLLASYQPGVEYKAYPGASAEEWIPTAEAFAFSLDSPRYYVKRGVEIVNESGRRMRTVGDLVVDGFVENDPPTEYIRSTTRHIFVPGNIDHTVRSTGTFA